MLKALKLKIQKKYYRTKYTVHLVKERCNALVALMLFVFLPSKYITEYFLKAWKGEDVYEDNNIEGADL